MWGNRGTFLVLMIWICQVSRRCVVRGVEAVCGSRAVQVKSGERDQTLQATSRKDTEIFSQQVNDKSKVDRQERRSSSLEFNPNRERERLGWGRSNDNLCGEGKEVARGSPHGGGGENSFRLGKLACKGG